MIKIEKYLIVLTFGWIGITTTVQMLLNTDLSFVELVERVPYSMALEFEY